ncbi:hypothetical protein [Planctobacterium marinum]|uniref:hypothetical protein n=1 Tax=Planctobacterium marinum TaxID=1631968 RepID=UPI001E3C75C8|nr:hypothetical protein [Planctobacterium marinum]MCC2608007.1 hypothetical protein [Planctobacterium marinum]
MTELIKEVFINSEFFFYLITGFIGVVFGATELISRYKEKPFQILLGSHSIIYMMINAAASVLALYIIQINEFTFGIQANNDDAKLVLVKILVAGMASMTLFRSSLFNLKIGESEVNVGPNAILQIILRTVDREVDRKNAEKKADAIPKEIKSLSLDLISNDLPTIALSLMSNLDNEEIELFRMKMARIRDNTQLSETTKKIAIACSLSSIVGVDVLKKATKMCRGSDDEVAETIANELDINEDFINDLEN